MTEEEHRLRHRELYFALSEVLSDYIGAGGGVWTPEFRKLITWIEKQATSPDHEISTAHPFNPTLCLRLHGQ